MSPTPVPERLLLATDGSPVAELATTVAARIAAAQDAELIVVHVVAATEHRLSRMATPVPVTRRLDDPLANLVLARARQLSFEEGVTFTPVLLAGDPSLAVVALPRSVKAQLLIIGAARRRLSAFGHGLVARRVESRAPCPVLAVQTPPAARPSRRRAPRLAPVARLVPRGASAPACPCCSDGGCSCCGTPPIAV
jgi:nucleotide-binding universal stress UspA family protein